VYLQHCIAAISNNFLIHWYLMIIFQQAGTNFYETDFCRTALWYCGLHYYLSAFLWKTCMTVCSRFKKGFSRTFFHLLNGKNRCSGGIKQKVSSNLNFASQDEKKHDFQVLEQAFFWAHHPYAHVHTIGVARIFSRGGDTIPDVRLYWELDYSRTRSVLDPEAGGVWGGAL